MWDDDAPEGWQHVSDHELDAYIAAHGTDWLHHASYDGHRMLRLAFDLRALRRWVNGEPNDEQHGT